MLLFPLPICMSDLMLLSVCFIYHGLNVLCLFLSLKECYPNSTGGLQCQCEKQFAWSCDKCNSYGACSNATSQTCECINGLPDGEYCEPITSKFCYFVVVEIKAMLSAKKVNKTIIGCICLTILHRLI